MVDRGGVDLSCPACCGPNVSESLHRGPDAVWHLAQLAVGVLGVLLITGEYAPPA